MSALFSPDGLRKSGFHDEEGQPGGPGRAAVRRPPRAGDLRRAEALLHEAAARHGWPVRTFTDFSPTNFFAEQGMLLEVTSAAD